MQVHEQYEKLRERKATPAALVMGGMSEQRQIQASPQGREHRGRHPRAAGRLSPPQAGRSAQREDPGSRRIRSHARHGLSAGDSPHRRGAAARAPDAVLLGDAGSFGGQPGQRLHEQSGARGAWAPPRSRPTPSSCRPSKCRRRRSPRCCASFSMRRRDRP